jgi:hypothetical protein
MVRINSAARWRLGWDRRGRRQKWQGLLVARVEGKWWELTNDVPWVKLQVPARAEGIAAEARSWSTMPTAAALLAKKVVDADRAKQQAASTKQQEEKDNPTAWSRERRGS